jgi:hypothetical protein
MLKLIPRPIVKLVDILVNSAILEIQYISIYLEMP